MKNKVLDRCIRFSRRKFKGFICVTSILAAGVVAVDFALAGSNVFRDNVARFSLRVTCERLPLEIFGLRPFALATYQNGNNDLFISYDGEFVFFRPNGSSISVPDRLRFPPVSPIAVSSARPSVQDVERVRYSGVAIGSKFVRRGFRIRTELTFYDTFIAFPSQTVGTSCPPELPGTRPPRGH